MILPNNLLIWGKLMYNQLLLVLMGLIPTFCDIIRFFLVERSGNSRKAIDKLHIFHVLNLTQPVHVQFKEESETSPYEL